MAAAFSSICGLRVGPRAPLGRLRAEAGSVGSRWGLQFLVVDLGLETLTGSTLQQLRLLGPTVPDTVFIRPSLVALGSLPLAKTIEVDRVHTHLDRLTATAATRQRDRIRNQYVHTVVAKVSDIEKMILNHSQSRNRAVAHAQGRPAEGRVVEVRGAIALPDSAHSPKT